MPARWYRVKIKPSPQLLSSSPTSIIAVITCRSYGITSLSTQLGVRFKKESDMTLGEGALGEFALGETAATKAVSAIESSELIPLDAKQAIRSFIKESFEKIWSSLDELISIQPPIELAEYWDIVIKIIQSLL
jgi:hypothetical protein